MRVVLATGNLGKLREFAEMLGAAGLSFEPSSAFGLESPEETGLTFVDNALLKARHAGIEGHPGIKSVEAQLWELARQLTPEDRSAAYTQAIMDLGATLCVRSRPLCAACPVGRDCVARLRGLQDRLPGARPRKARPRKSAHVVIAVQSGGAVLLERRPASGIWGGLWSFPQFDAVPDAEAWITCALEVQGSRLEWPPLHHAFTHFDLSLYPLVLKYVTPASQVADTERYCWYDPRTPVEVGLAAPVAELIKAVTRGR